MRRKHQKNFDATVDKIIEGSGVNIIDVIATPGAGKSSIPIQACRLIKAGLADKIMWVVPRSALQNQGERGFIDPFFMDMFNHNFMIRESTNEINPCRGTDGFVTTYQAIGVDKEKTVLREVKSRRYIIVLDEFHHLEDGGIWHDAIKDIVESCHFLIKMTGTLGRGDKKKIAFVDYKGSLPHFNDHSSVIYSRTDALKEKAILPIEFHLRDGEFKWKRKNGKTSVVKSFKTARTPTKASEALFTAIHSEFAADLLRECVLHWNGERKKNPGAQMLIVAADIVVARDILFMLNRSMRINAEIATSHDSSEAVRAINEFKARKIKCLVTIAMAYEGLDAPGVTHICSLTNIRSREWIEQMLARGVRIDRLPSAGVYDRQKCYVFAPMDNKFKEVVDLIKKQQISAIEYFAKIKEEKEADQEENTDVDGIEEVDLFGDPLPTMQQIEPISAKMTLKDRFTLGLDSDINHVTSQIAQPLTIKEQETDLRRSIQKHVNSFCFENRYKPQRINRELKDKFGKKRELMTLQELKSLSSYLLKHYPIDRTIAQTSTIPGVSGQRGVSNRVTSKVLPWTGRSEILKQSCYDPIRHLLKK